MRLAIFVMLMLPLASIAVDYTLPDDGNWYQLQSQDGQQTFCQTGGPTCSIPGGTQVKLINHSLPFSDPNHSRSFTIDPEGTTPMQTNGIELIYQPAIATAVDINVDSKFFTIPCPANTVPVAANCDLDIAGADGGRWPLETETFIGRESVTCGFLGAPFITRTELANFSGTAICAVGTVISTLPVIDTTVQ